MWRERKVLWRWHCRVGNTATKCTTTVHIKVFLKTSFHLHFVHFPAKKSTSGSVLRNIVSRYKTFHPLTIVSGLGWTWTYHGYPLETLWKSNCKFCFLHLIKVQIGWQQMKITRWWVEQNYFFAITALRKWGSGIYVPMSAWSNRMHG